MNNIKKLLCFALFSIAILANATEKKEIVENISNELKMEKESNLTIGLKTKTNNCHIEMSQHAVFFGCGSEGNGRYTSWREQGYTHREARSLRREYVRECRGYFWQFF